MIIPMTGEAYTSIAPQFSNQTCINWYRSVQTSQASVFSSAKATTEQNKYPSALWPTPGTIQFVDLNGSQIRGLYSTPSYLYAVCDNSLYRISPNGTVLTITNRLFLNPSSTSTGRVKFTSNSTQIKIDDGVAGYVVTNLTSTQPICTTISSANYQASNKTTYQDGYGIAVIPNANTIQFSHLNDFLNYDANMVTSIESTTVANPIISCETCHLVLWIFGLYNAEIWNNQGTVPVPFSRIGTTLVEHGLHAEWSLLNMDNTLFWLASNEHGHKYVIKASGYDVTIISTEALHHEFQSYTTTSDAFAFSYNNNNHVFYVLHFPSQDKTWVYDSATTLWHQWSTFRDGKYGRHLSNCHAVFNNKQYVGDYKSGKIYQLTDSVYTDNGNPIVRERTFPTVQQEQGRFSVNYLELDMQKGIGLSTGQGSNPRIMLSISSNSGETFGDEMYGDIGAAGKYKAKIRFNRLGQYRNFTPKITISDPVFAAPFAAMIDVQQDTP